MGRYGTGLLTGQPISVPVGAMVWNACWMVVIPVLVGILPLVKHELRRFGRVHTILQTPGDNDTNSIDALAEAGYPAA